MPQQNPDPQHATAPYPRLQQPAHPPQQYGYMYSEPAPDEKRTATTWVLLALLVATLLVGVCSAAMSAGGEDGLKKRGRSAVVTDTVDLAPWLDLR